MKKSLNKVIVTLAAVTALAAAMSVTAFADVTANAPTDGKTSTTYEKTATAGEQVTLLVLKPDADATDGIDESEIAYIDQTAADETGKATFTIKLTDVAEDSADYQIFSSTASATEAPTKEDLKIDSGVATIHYGDINNDNNIDTSDAIAALNIFTGTGSYTDDQKAAADVNKDTKVDTSDAIAILNYFVGNKAGVDDSWRS
jgi:hypothetical protein